MTCPYCQGSLVYVLRLFKNHLQKNNLDPKWVTHIYLRCINCGKKQGGAIPQTEELRKQLDGSVLAPIDFDEIQTERLGGIPLKIPNEES